MSELQHIGFDYGAMPINDMLDLRASAERIKIRLKRTAEDIIEIGKELIIAKEKCGHGHFENWLQAEFEMTIRSAQNFMNVANEFGDKSEIISFFKPTALYALAAPSTSEEVRTEVLQRVENGEKITVAEIERLKKEKAELETRVNTFNRANRELSTEKQMLERDLEEVTGQHQREKTQLEESLQSTKSSLDFFQNNYQELQQSFNLLDKSHKALAKNIEKKAEAMATEKANEKQAELEAKIKADLKMEYQDEIAEQQERIDSLKAQIANETLTATEIEAKHQQLHLAEQQLLDVKQQLSDLDQQISERRNAIQTEDDINNGLCNVLDDLIATVAAHLSQLDINIEDDNVTALYPLTNITLQKVDKTIAKLDDTMQILTLLLRHQAA